MCGIFGIWNKDLRSIDVSAIQRALNSVRHRGPDDEGYLFIDSKSGQCRPAGGPDTPESVFTSNFGYSPKDRVDRMVLDGADLAIANRRLAILDLSPAGHQPMCNEDGSLWITHNGEIYNYLELRAELQQLGHHFHSNTDTEVILHAYQEWGPECVGHFNGMWAFALWDAGRKLLFCSRDRFGIKPFYYYWDGKQFIFASEIKAILATGLVKAQPNNAAIYNYLAYQEIDSGSDTLFQKISTLPPAHSLSYTYGSDAPTIFRYWDLDPASKIGLPNDHAYAERFLELLTDAVRIRLRSDVPVGSSLSGGLDSSAIVCLIGQLRNDNIQKTFSARFHDPKYDEGPYIQRAVERSGAKGSTVYPEPMQLPEDIDKLTWHQDHPFLSTSIFAQWKVMGLAREQGVTVLLDGQGGDETLAGYLTYFGTYYRELLRRLHWWTLVESLYRYGLDQGWGSLRGVLFMLFPNLISRSIRRILRPSGIPAEYQRRWSSNVDETPPKFDDALHEALYQTLTRTHLPSLLRYADRNSMAFAREARFPFLDHRLVEFLFSVPVDQKIRQATTKVVLRNATVGVMPEEIRVRKDKLGFTTPQQHWLLGPLRPWVGDILESQSFLSREWIEPLTVRRLWREFQGGRMAYHGLIWRWISLEIWARCMLDDSQMEQPTR